MWLRILVRAITVVNYSLPILNFLIKHTKALWRIRAESQDDESK
jgi:hypothetical protein